MPSPLPCSPVVREWLWKKVQIKKKMLMLLKWMVSCCLVLIWENSCFNDTFKVSLALQILFKISCQMSSFNEFKLLTNFGKISWILILYFESRLPNLRERCLFLLTSGRKKKKLQFNTYYMILLNYCWVYIFSLMNFLKVASF